MKKFALGILLSSLLPYAASFGPSRSCIQKYMKTFVQRSIQQDAKHASRRHPRAGSLSCTTDRDDLLAKIGNVAGAGLISLLVGLSPMPANAERVGEIPASGFIFKVREASYTLSNYIRLFADARK